MSLSPSPRLIALGSAFFAGLLWGAWTYYINKEAPNVLMSTAVQFTSSIIMTVAMSFIVVKTQPLFNGAFSRVLCPALASSSVAIAMLLVSHLTVNTQNVLVTIAAPVLVGFIYSLVYAHKISTD